MNNLVLTKKRVLKAERLHKAQLETFKKGVFTSYRPSVLEERQSKLVKKLQQWILKQELNPCILIAIRTKRTDLGQSFFMTLMKIG